MFKNGYRPLTQSDFAPFHKGGNQAIEAANPPQDRRDLIGLGNGGEQRKRLAVESTPKSMHVAL